MPCLRDLARPASGPAFHWLPQDLCGHPLKLLAAQRPLLGQMSTYRLQLVVSDTASKPLSPPVRASAGIGAQPQIKRMHRQHRLAAEAQVLVDARPAIVFRPGDESCPDRVQFDVANHVEEITIGLDEGRLEAPLPKCARPSMAQVECLRVCLPHAPHDFRYCPEMVGGEQ